MKVPFVNHVECSQCGGCIEICPEIFGYNDVGFINVMDVEEYPEDLINEAIAICPEDCILWDED